MNDFQQSLGILQIRDEQMIHSLTRISAAGDIPPEPQMIGFFAGFQASTSDEVTKSKPRIIG